MTGEGGLHGGKPPQIECDEDELADLRDRWIPVRLEQDEYRTPLRKADAQYDLVRA